MKFCDINPYIYYAGVHDYVRTHKHSDADEVTCSYNGRLFYIEEGECHVRIEDTEYTVKKDTLMLWRAGTPYCFLSLGTVKMIVLNFDYTQISEGRTKSIKPVPLRKFQPECMEETESFENYEPFNKPLIMENMQTLRKNLLKIIDKYNGSRLYKNEAASAVLKSVLTEIAAISSYSENKTFAKLDMVLEYLKENFDKDITNEDLGRLTGYHPYYLNRLFLKHIGITLRQQLILLRIENAKDMLVQTDLSILEIAEKCGFNNTSYFSGYFKTRVGMSPVKYRKKYKNRI